VYTMNGLAELAPAIIMLGLFCVALVVVCFSRTTNRG